jgi:CRP/FNR family transcriptional regulator, cyclic AMP receptor protein
MDSAVIDIRPYLRRCCPE